MKTVEIICKYCNKKAEKNKAEIKRQLKKGRTNFYCSIKCSSKHSKTDHLKKWCGKYNHNLKYGSNLDKYSDFKWYIKTIKLHSKKRNHIFDVDVEYLKELWEKQNGICPITYKKLELRNHRYNNKSQPYSASLDRIDNSKGYIKGNIRFVALIYNYARNTFSDQDVIDFCKIVAKNNLI